MLFWAGLRGAVGFALSAGIEGEHATALQTTVLVTVVLTVIFGGTTAQMLEILGIRMGVTDDDDADSDEEEELQPAFGAAQSLRLALVHPVRRRRRRRRDPNTVRTNGAYYDDDDDDDDDRQEGDQLLENRFSPTGSFTAALEEEDAYPPHLRYSGPAESTEDDEVLPSVVRSPHARHASSSKSSSTPPRWEGTESHLPSFEPNASWDVDPRSSVALGVPASSAYSAPHLLQPSEQGPSALDLTEARTGGGATARQLIDRAGLIFRDGQWFQKIDERYLLPLFGNSVAQRKADEERARRWPTSHQSSGTSGSSTPRNPGGGGTLGKRVVGTGKPEQAEGTTDEPDANVVLEEEVEEEDGPLKTLGSIGGSQPSSSWQAG